MRYDIYSIYDKQALAYQLPFYTKEPTDSDRDTKKHATAIRSFIDKIMDETSKMSEKPANYSLWYFGSFNDEIGFFDLFCRAPSDSSDDIDGVRVIGGHVAKKRSLINCGFEEATSLKLLI